MLDGEKKITAVYDSGSNITVINEKVIKELRKSVLESEELLHTISGVQGKIKKTKMKIRINKMEHLLEVYVVKNDNFSYDLLLGLNAIKQFKLIQDENLRIFQRVERKLEEIKRETKEEKKIQTNCQKVKNTEVEKKLKHLNTEKQIELRKVITNNKTIFANNKYDVGKVRNHEAQIKLLENRYISKKPYRCSIPDQEEIDNQVNNLLEANLIEESTSPYAAPVTLAFKKEDGRRSRLCIDFRGLNEILVPEPQPFPRIEDTIIKTRNCK